MTIKEIEEAIDMIYQAAVCAVCQCDDNAAGMFPCNCNCAQTEQRDKILKMLRDVRQEQLDKLK